MGKTQGEMMKAAGEPDLGKVTEISPDILASGPGIEMGKYLEEAREFLLYYDWCEKIDAEYVGLFVDGILGVFLFRITPALVGVDEWIWVIVGDVPPAYLTCEECPNPATALDGYIGALSEWVDAAAAGESVEGLIPVNVPATPEFAEQLRTRLLFLDEEILSQYQDDLDQ